MATALFPLLLAGCNSGTTGDESKIIEKPDISVENGMLTPEILEAFGRVANPVVSPDGKQIAFTLAYEDIEENKGNAEIYIMSVDGGEPKRLTRTASSESNLQWLANGERIAFLRHDKESDASQIFTIGADGKAEKKLSNVKNGIECFKISPDEKKIIYASPIDAFNKDSVLFEGLPKTTGRVIDDLGYKHWDEWVTKIPHPFIADFDEKGISEGKDIMEGEPYECPMRPFGGAESFAWNPDSKSLIYVSRKLKGKEYVFSTDSNLYLYNLENGETSEVKGMAEGYDTDPVYSPDGKYLAWLSMKTAKYESDKKRLMLQDLSTGETKDLTENWDYWPEQIAWNPDSKSIVFAGYCQGVEPIFRINIATSEIETLANEQADFPVALPVNNTDVIGLRHSMQYPNEIIAVKGLSLIHI